MDKHLLFISGNDIDYFYEVESFLGKGDAGMAKPLYKAVGGCVLNAACVASKLGSNVKVLDYLKEEDDDTELLINSLLEYGVNIDNIVYGKDATNGQCLIMKKDDEKCIYVIEPKRPYFNEDEKIKELLFNSKYIYSLMHTLNLSFKTVDILKEAKINGSKIIFDGSSQYKEEYEKEMLLQLADGLFINIDSYKRLKDVCGFEPIDFLINRGCEFICLTEGGKGATCYTKEKIYKCPAYKIDVIDSTGAGDSFAGCFLHFRSLDYSYEECLKLASLNGSYACSKNGGRAGAISEKELFDFRKNYTKI